MYIYIYHYLCICTHTYIFFRHIFYIVTMPNSIPSPFALGFSLKLQLRHFRFNLEFRRPAGGPTWCSDLVVQLHLPKYHMWHMKRWKYHGNIMEISWKYHENIMKLLMDISWTYHEISWNIMKYHEISWNIMKYHQFSWTFFMTCATFAEKKIRATCPMIPKWRFDLSLRMSSGFEPLRDFMAEKNWGTK